MTRHATQQFETDVMSIVGGDEGEGGGEDVQGTIDRGTGGGADTGTPGGGSDTARGPGSSGIDRAIDRIDGGGTRQAPGTQRQAPGTQQPRKVLDTDGTEVAPGSAQRHFFARKKAEGALSVAQNKLASFEGELNAFRNASAAAQQLGLSAQDMGTAYALLHNIRTKPKDTVKQLLTELQATGMNLNEVTGNGAFDADAVKRMIAGELKPLTDAMNGRREHAAIVGELETEFNNLYDDEPHARANEGLIGAILERNSAMSAGEAWAKLQVRSLRMGLNVEQPLLPQLVALAKRAQNGGRNGASFIPGPGGGGGNGARPVIDSEASMDPRTSMRDITRAAINEAKKQGLM